MIVVMFVVMVMVMVMVQAVSRRSLTAEIEFDPRPVRMGLYGG